MSSFRAVLKAANTTSGTCGKFICIRKPCHRSSITIIVVGLGSSFDHQKRNHTWKKSEYIRLYGFGD